LSRKFESLKGALEKAKKKGVSVRIVAPINAKNYKVAKELSKYADVRHGKMKSRFALSDGKEMLLMILDDEVVHPNYDVGVWVNSPFFGNALNEMFSASWETMTPLNKVKI